MWDQSTVIQLLQQINSKLATLNSYMPYLIGALGALFVWNLLKVWFRK